MYYLVITWVSSGKLQVVRKFLKVYRVIESLKNIASREIFRAVLYRCIITATTTVVLQCMLVERLQRSGTTLRFSSHGLNAVPGMYLTRFSFMLVTSK